MKASRTASILATSTDEREISESRKVFWRLYWGELALVENSGVEIAMINFGAALKHGRS
ncbi:hypothetical protein D3C75_1258910 [compost metagenome]